MAICSQHGKSARELADLYGIESVYTSSEELLESKEVETVFIVTPPYLHREMAERAMERGKNVLVEKPLCTTYHDTELLLARANRYPKTFYAAFNNQFREENQWLRSRILQGELGDVELIDLEWYRTKRYGDKQWLYDPRLGGGGALMDFGVHLVRFALSLLPDRWHFKVFCSHLRRHGRGQVEDTSVAVVTVNDRVGIVIKAGWDLKLPSPSSVVLRVYGNKGYLSNLDFEGPKSDGFGQLVEDFFHYVETGTSPDLAPVLNTMRLIDALYRSSVAGSVLHGEFSEINNGAANS